jgi:hypothetical protein
MHEELNQVFGEPEGDGDVREEGRDDACARQSMNLRLARLTWS